MTITPELREQVNEVFEKFEEFKEQFLSAPYSQKQKEFFVIMENFRIYLASFEDEQLIALVMHSERYSEYKAFFRHQNDYFMRAIETVEALDIITDNVGVNSALIDIISTDYLKNRYMQKGHDLRLADFSNAKKVVMVGCGPFPDTILHIYENTNVSEIVGIDYNEEAIHIASQFINNLGFDRIKLVCMDGSKYDYADADLVYIAGFVQPKHEILKQIAETSQKKDVQIIVDSALGMSRLLYEHVDKNNVHPRLDIKQKDYSKTPFSTQEMIKLVKYDI